MNETRIAIMQPYFFPYIGYFHLIHASSFFVFYDDVQYSKGGWINRNRIACNGKDFFITIPVSRHSNKKYIKDVEPIIDKKWVNTFYKQIICNYKNTVGFHDVIDSIMSIFDEKHYDISSLAIDSVVAICSYLGLNFTYTRSSLYSPENVDTGRSERLIGIIKKNNCKYYINSYGGRKLYDKSYFLSKDIFLQFVKSNIIEYKQYNNIFIPNLSIIDVVMHNRRENILDLLLSYSIE